MRNLIITALFIVLSGASAFAQKDGPVKLKGQVVCSSCWFEASDRKKNPYGTTADIECAIDCSKKDLPQALAVEDEKGFTLYLLEKGAFKTTGKDFLDIVPKTVEIEGDLRTEKDKRFVKVNSLKVIKETFVKPTPVSDDAVLALKDLTGAEQSLAGYRGRVVVLNFWATWCEPCKKEMPDLSAIQNDYAALGVQVIGASGDAASDSAKVLKFIREYKLNFPVWVGTATTDMERFGVGTVLPATVIIDRDGKIVWREIGIIKPAELRKELDKLLLPKVTEAVKVAKADKAKTKNTSLVPA
ncbi:MAG: TlpA family protein disulfide reductase [Acidobacteria bacterium]|nr:TlpA family protein disulfide reductase [Acidobacteriota bacterium]